MSVALRVPRHRARLLVVGMVLLAVAGCSAGAPEVQNVGQDLNTGEEGAPGGRAASPQTPDRVDEGSMAAIGERRIVKTGEIRLEVSDVAASLSAVRSIASDLGGYVGGTQAGTAEESASLTLRVPADRFDEALAAIHDLDGELLGETTREEDVTGALVDIQARLQNLQASERQYRALIQRAQRVRDILLVQSRLDGVRGEIEQLSAQLKQLSGQADLATLTVRLMPKPAPVEQATEDWDPGVTAGNAVAALLTAAQGAVTAAIWLGIVVLPMAVVVTVILAIGAWLIPVVRRRLPARGEP